MKSTLAAGIILCLCTSSIMAELISTNLSNGDVLNQGVNIFRRRGVTNTFFLPEGKRLIIHGINPFIGNSQGVASPFLRKVITNNISIVIYGGSYWNGPIVGPMQIEYGLSEAGHSTGDFPRTTANFLLEIKESPFSSTLNSTKESSSVVVIPENILGGVDVLLEQSSDMVTWIQCLPGTYNASTQKRFFRIRALEK